MLVRGGIKLKKLLSMLMLSLVLVLAACGDDESEKEKPEAKEPQVQDEVEKDDPEEVEESEEEPETYEVLSTEINFHDGAMTVSGKTNLPKGDEVMISISNDEMDYFANDKDEVDASGVFSSAAFTKQGDPLPPGEYQVSITSVNIGKLEHEETVTVE